MVFGFRLGSYVPGPQFSTKSLATQEEEFQEEECLPDSCDEENHFSLKSAFMVGVRFELTTNDPCPADNATC